MPRMMEILMPKTGTRHTMTQHTDTGNGTETGNKAETDTETERESQGNGETVIESKKLSKWNSLFVAQLEPTRMRW